MITRKKFGVLADGQDTDLYILKAGDLTLCVSTYGATLVSLVLPQASGKNDDVLLGFSTLTPYTTSHPFFGVTVGRYANRIAGASFSLAGSQYQLPANDGRNTLHGGNKGFDKANWRAEAYSDKGGVFVSLSLTSPDGDEGFPGSMETVVVYGLSDDNRLIAEYRAKVDRPCPVNLTNHAYFNLKGEGNGDILDHELLLYADAYLPVNESLIPSGEIASIADGPFDFRQAKRVGADIAKTGVGYDHCFVLKGKPGTLRPCAEVYEKVSGRRLSVRTTQPGVQFYSGNFLSNIPGKRGSVYGKHEGFCLETQHFPDSPNQAGFPSCIFGPDRDYHEQTEFQFSW